MKYFNYLCSMMTNDARYTREIKSRAVMERDDSFHQQTGLKFKEDLRMVLKLGHFGKQINNT